MEYCKVKNYSMKCRLYPNKKQSEFIDKAINAVALYTNMCIYNLFNYFDGTKETKDENGNVAHWVNLNSFMQSTYLQNARLKDSRINNVPAYALSGNAGCINTDLKKRLLQSETVFERAAKEKAKKEGKKYKRKVPVIDNVSKAKIKYPVEKLIPSYYSKKNPRMSYTYQENIFKKIVLSENKNVFYIKLTETKTNKIETPIKVRGWNQKIRFGKNQDMNFLEWVEYNRNNNVNKSMTVCVKKDIRGYYWIIFKISECYVETNNIENKEVGIDVGIKDIIITSDDTKFENKRFKLKAKRKIKALNRRLSRRMGWANIAFRELYKGNRTIEVSKRYNKIMKRLSKIHMKTADERELYNNQITKQIIDNYSFIAVETLQVKNMFRNKHLSFALSDASMGDILAKLNYKANWHNREIISIDQWSPSTKRCSHCGYIIPKMSLAIRQWNCPECNTHHDRDVNAAKNILYYAKNSNKKEKKKTA